MSALDALWFSVLGSGLALAGHAIQSRYSWRWIAAVLAAVTTTKDIVTTVTAVEVGSMASSDSLRSLCTGLRFWSCLWLARMWAGAVLLRLAWRRNPAAWRLLKGTP